MFGVGLAGLEPATFGPPARSRSNPGVHAGARKARLCWSALPPLLSPTTPVHERARTFDGKVMAELVALSRRGQAVRKKQPGREACSDWQGRIRRGRAASAVTSRYARRQSRSDAAYPAPLLPGAPLPAAVVVGEVVGAVGGDDDGGGGSDAPACGPGAGAAGGGIGSGAGGDGSLATAALGALVGGVVMAGRDGGAVVGTVFVSRRAGWSSSLSTATIDTKPTRNADTHASEIATARPPIREKKERSPSSSSAAAIDSRWASSCRRAAPSVSGSSAGLVGAPSASRCAARSIAWSTSWTPLGLTSEVVTIGGLPPSIRSLGSHSSGPQGSPEHAGQERRTRGSLRGPG
jgi:hypothetical protein